MDKTVVIILSPEAKIRGAFLNISNILKSLGFKCLIVTNSKNIPAVNPSNNVSFYKFFLYEDIRNAISKLPRIFKNLMEQILVLLTLIKILNKAHYFLFSHVLMPIPAIGLKLLRKKSLILVGGISHLVVPTKEFLIKKLTLLMEDFHYKLSDVILVVSKGFIRHHPLLKYEEKIFETPIVLLNDEFLRRFNFSRASIRRNIVGFVGRFSHEKGILEFVDSLPLIISQRRYIHFLIIGDGPLKDIIIERIKSFRLDKCIKILPWVANVEVYLRQIKLLVVPSIREGLPSIILESMIIGTPVLATSVGAVPYVVKDGETGFLLKSNDPKHIADIIIELLNKPELLEKVSTNAYEYVKENFSYEKTLEAWRKIFEQL